MGRDWAWHELNKTSHWSSRDSKQADDWLTPSDALPGSSPPPLSYPYLSSSLFLPVLSLTFLYSLPSSLFYFFLFFIFAISLPSPFSPSPTLPLPLSYPLSLSFFHLPLSLPLPSTPFSQTHVSFPFPLVYLRGTRCKQFTTAE